MHLSSKTPKNSKNCSLSISLLFIFNCYNKSEILSVLICLWKIEYLDVFIIMDNLLDINHS